MSEVKQYRKKPVIVEAVQLNGGTAEAIKVWGGSSIGYYHSTTGTLYIETLEGKMTANTGDYIIKGTKGEFYPCKPDIFKAIYEPAGGVK